MNDIVDNTQETASAANPDLRWYVVHAYSGMEKAVERNIRESIARAGMENKFGRILVPTEEVVEMKNGQRRTAMCLWKWSWTTSLGIWSNTPAK